MKDLRKGLHRDTSVSGFVAIDLSRVQFNVRNLRLMEGEGRHGADSRKKRIFVRRHLNKKRMGSSL
jgi:hypothetical protein